MPPPDVLATLLQIASRQRMLSQRIVLFALLAERGDPDALPVAQEALALFRGSHATLSRGRDGLPGPFTDELKQVFFGPSGSDAAVVTFVRIADDALTDIGRAASTAERRLQTLVAQATAILVPLGRLAQAYEGMARRQALAARRAQEAAAAMH
jgi:hypothetical protein